MRDYAKLSPKIWIGPKARLLRKAGGLKPRIVYLHLRSGPNCNMIGIYYIPKTTISHETDISEPDVGEALFQLEQVGLVFYDDEQEIVWVPDVAEEEIGERLKPGDNRIKAIEKELMKVRECKFCAGFIQKHGEAYRLSVEGLRRSFEAPLKPEDRNQKTEEEKQKGTEEQNARAADSLFVCPEERSFSEKTTSAFDERYVDFESYISESWRKSRGTLLGSVTTEWDFRELRSMLDRTSKDPACTLKALKAAWDSFMESPEPFHKKQGLRFFCTSGLTQFLRVEQAVRHENERNYHCAKCRDTGAVTAYYDKHDTAKWICHPYDGLPPVLGKVALDYRCECGKISESHKSLPVWTGPCGCLECEDQGVLKVVRHGEKVICVEPIHREVTLNDEETLTEYRCRCGANGENGESRPIWTGESRDEAFKNMRELWSARLKSILEKTKMP